MARPIKQNADKALQRQLSGDYGINTKFDAVAPQAAMYGVFAPQYAASLAASTGAAGADILNQGTLQMRADNEAAEYARQLAATRAAQLQGQQQEIYGALQGKIIDREPEGMIGMRSVRMGPNGPEVINDPLLQMTSNAQVVNEAEAEKRLTNAQANAANYSAGLKVDPNVAAQRDTHILQPDQDPAYGLFNPQGTTARDEAYAYGMSQGLTDEQQFEMQRLKNQARAQGLDETEYTIDLNPVTNEPFLKIKGGQDVYGMWQNMRNGNGPPAPPNPKAGAQGGGAPAKPATDARPINNANIVAASLFPGIQITEHRRDPNSALGRANPGSWHNKSGAAIDSKAVPGMTFEQYVDKYKKAGYEILEAIDEYKHPSKHSTGKHWHVVLGQRNNNVQTPQGQPTRVSNLQLIATRAKQNGDKISWDGETLIVTRPNGASRRFGP